VAPFHPVAARDDRAPVPTHVLAVRALRPPAPARVQLRSGRPGFIESGLARGAVLRCAGPWRTTGRWWSEEERFAFDHYDVQVEDGWVVRLRFDWRTNGWQIDGVYD
jgi:protein ImuB